MNLTPCEEQILAHIELNQVVEGRFDICLDLGLNYSWTGECIRRLEAKRLIHVVNTGRGRGHKLRMIARRRPGMRS